MATLCTYSHILREAPVLVSDPFSFTPTHFVHFPMSHLQHIADDAHRPHVSLRSDGLVIYNFRSNKFRCSKQNSHWGVFTQLLRQTEIYQFDIVRVAGCAHDVFWLPTDHQNSLKNESHGQIMVYFSFPETYYSKKTEKYL